MTATTDERQSWIDASTGCRVTQWTTQSSNHLYFTHPGWFDENRQLLITVDGPDGHHLVALDLEHGTQRPVLGPVDGVQPSAFEVSVDARNARAYTWLGRDLIAIDCLSGQWHRLYRLPPGYDGIIPNVTADGTRVCFGETERSNLDFNERFASHPRSRILVHDLTNGTTETLFERDLWLGHINTAPGRPELLSYCHEGPWTRVEHRVWCLNLRDGRTWRVRPLNGPPACIGHEYWLGDGRRIAYHGFNQHAEPVLGIASVDNTEFIEHHQPVKTKHTHSLDGRLVIGDGNPEEPWILAWLMSDTAIRGPWRVCRHDGGWPHQRHHVHPRIAPDGRSVFFTSDRLGAPMVYSVELPEKIENLPPVACART